jgi:hypothetical protein
MRDHMMPRDEGSPERERSRRNPESSAPLSDREVPLDVANSSDVINRWLDGELPEPVGLRGDAARRVEFWRRVGEETERRRQVVTPPYVSTQIMEAIANAAEAVEAPWYRRRVEISPMTMLIGGAALLVVGALVASALR